MNRSLKEIILAELKRQSEISKSGSLYLYNEEENEIGVDGTLDLDALVSVIETECQIILPDSEPFLVVKTKNPDWFRLVEKRTGRVLFEGSKDRCNAIREQHEFCIDSKDCERCGCSLYRHLPSDGGTDVGSCQFCEPSTEMPGCEQYIGMLPNRKV